MARMKAVEAAVLVLEREGVSVAFGVPGAAINPLYAALRKRGSIRHILARHVEAASHMADGYTRAKPGAIGVCIGTSGPAGTDMITGLYAAAANSIPILCITGQAPRAKLYKEDFQAIDIESIAKPVAKWSVTVREPAQVPMVFQQAFHIMRRVVRARCTSTCRSTFRRPRSNTTSRPMSRWRCTSRRQRKRKRSGRWTC